MTKRYILNDKGDPIEEPNLLTWGKWFEVADRHIASDEIEDVKVSTVFLGIDHSFETGNHKPVLFETMVFNGEHDQYQERYTNKVAALAGHDRAAAMIRESMNKKK